MVRRFRSDERGATAVEFALVLWPFVMVLFGSVEVSRVLWSQTALNKTAITAARCIGIRATDCARDGAYDAGLAAAYIRSEARGWGLGLAPDQIVVADATDCDGAPGFSKVTLTVAFLSPLPFIARALVGTKDRIVAEACFPTQAAAT